MVEDRLLQNCPS